jgi:hypothetical protein
LGEFGFIRCKIVPTEEFQVEFRNVAVDYIQFQKTLGKAVNLFLGTGSILQKPGSGAVRKRTDEIVAYAQDNEKFTKNVVITQISPVFRQNSNI